MARKDLSSFFHFWLHFVMSEHVSPFERTYYHLTKTTKSFTVVLIDLSWEIKTILRFELLVNYTYF